MNDLELFVAFALFEIVFEITLIAITVLIVNPKSVTKKVRAAIPEMAPDVVESVFKELDAHPERADGLMNRLQQKLQGTAMQFQRAIEGDPNEINALKRDIVTDVTTAQPELLVFLEMFPSVKKRIEKNPNLLPIALELIKKGVPQAKKYLIDNGLL